MQTTNDKVVQLQKKQCLGCIGCKGLCRAVIELAAVPEAVLKPARQTS